MQRTGGSVMAEDEVGGREAQYQAWAERMQAKRAANKARIADDVRSSSGAPSEPQASYWTTDALFADARMETSTSTSRPDPRVVAEMLAVLDLRDGADPDQLSAAYRRLAKVHHPDRFVGADDAIRAFHEERMLAVNRAYAHLKSLTPGSLVARS